ncbi:MAG: hypothetical protein H0V48_00510 [Nocardioidaceae bacterium]|nr:hypothetical protein [Nocardioidaceae bacterium]
MTLTLAIAARIGRPAVIAVRDLGHHLVEHRGLGRQPVRCLRRGARHGVGQRGAGGAQIADGTGAVTRGEPMRRLTLGALGGLERQLGDHDRVRDPTGGLVPGDDVDAQQDRDRLLLERGHVDVPQLEGGYVGVAQAHHRGNVEADQQLALLVGVETAELHQQAVRDHRRGQLVGQADTANVR